MPIPKRAPQAISDGPQSWFLMKSLQVQVSVPVQTGAAPNQSGQVSNIGASQDVPEMLCYHMHGTHSKPVAVEVVGAKIPLNRVTRSDLARHNVHVNLDLEGRPGSKATACKTV